MQKNELYLSLTEAQDYINSNISLLQKVAAILVNERLLDRKDKKEYELFLYDFLLNHFKQKAISKNMLVDKASYLAALIQQLNNKAIDLFLVKKQSPSIVLKYETLIWSVVNKMHQNGYINYDQKEDLFQQVVERLLAKNVKGQLQSFKGNSLFSTFLYTVIRREAHHIVKKQQFSYNEFDVNQHDNVTQNMQGYEETYNHYLNLLHNLLLAYQQPVQTKLHFCMQGVYRILLGEAFIKILHQQYPDCLQDVLLDILLVFGKNYTLMSKGELWQNINGFINELENKCTKADALRKWFESQRSKIWFGLFFNKMINMHQIQQLPQKEQQQFVQKKIKEHKKWINDFFIDIIENYYQEYKKNSSYNTR